MNMSRPLIAIVAAALTLTTGLSARVAAAEEKLVAGPNGGRIVKGPASARLEFHVGADRIARVRALGADLKPVATDKITASLRIQKPAATVTFTRTGGGADGPVHLVSTRPLPAGDPYPVALSLKSGKKSANVRFTFTTETCGECKLAEYACICGH